MNDIAESTQHPENHPVRQIEHIIIGAGPIGLEVAIAMKRAGLEYVQIDAGQIAQQIYEFPPATPFFSSNERITIAGVPVPSADQTKSTREQFLAYLRAVADQFDLLVNTYVRVIIVKRLENCFELTARKSNGTEQRYSTSKVVLATGGTAKYRELGIPGEDLPHVTHELGDPHQYWRRRVLIVGGKNSAVEAALRCYHVNAKVTMSCRNERLHRRVKYWLLPEIEMLIRTGRIDSHYSTVPVCITPTHVTLRSTADGEEFDVEAEHVLLMIGYRADMSLARALGVNLSDDELETPEFDEQTMQTNVPGVYIAGTATAGTQGRFAVYIENSHIHADRIVASLTGAAPPPQPEPIVQAET